MKSFAEPREITRLPREPRGLTRAEATARESLFAARVEDARLTRAFAQVTILPDVHPFQQAIHRVAAVFDEASVEFDRFLLRGLRGRHGRHNGRARKQLTRRIRAHDKQKRLEAQPSYGHARWTR